VLIREILRRADRLFSSLTHRLLSCYVEPRLRFVAPDRWFDRRLAAAQPPVRLIVLGLGHGFFCLQSRETRRDAMLLGERPALSKTPRDSK
jgi:hypothetical protein